MAAAADMTVVRWPKAPLPTTFAAPARASVTRPPVASAMATVKLS
jgi:hypothetical protein